MSAPVLRTVVDMQHFHGFSLHGIGHNVRKRVSASSLVPVRAIFIRQASPACRLIELYIIGLVIRNYVC